MSCATDWIWIYLKTRGHSKCSYFSLRCDSIDRTNLFYLDSNHALPVRTANADMQDAMKTPISNQIHAADAVPVTPALTDPTDAYDGVDVVGMTGFHLVSRRSRWRTRMHSSAPRSIPNWKRSSMT